MVSLRRAYELNSKDPAVCGNLGEALLRKGQPEEAARYLSESAALDSDHTNPYANRARGMLQEGGTREQATSRVKLLLEALRATRTSSVRLASSSDHLWLEVALGVPQYGERK